MDLKYDERYDAFRHEIRSFLGGPESLRETAASLQSFGLAS